MKIAKLLHNQKAGDEGHDKDRLISEIEAAGFECRYSSTEDWKGEELEAEIDFLVVAGGDGTVREIIRELLKKIGSQKILPIAVLPLGTANNISKTLQIEGPSENIIRSWNTAKVKKYDVGKISRVGDAFFFLESFGYGLFPYLMQEMEKADEASTDTPEKKKQTALELLHKITLSYEAKDCKLMIDGTDYSGKFLLIEIMNTRSIGPNLFLAPDSDPGDGVMEVVLLPEDDKEKFAAYILSQIKGSEENFTFKTIKANEASITWHGTHVHTDDEVLKMEDRTEVLVRLEPGLLEFIV